MDIEIVALTRAAPRAVEQAAVLLFEAFRGRTDDWQSLEAARQEVSDSLGPERISRVAVGAGGDVIGWIGACPLYDGRVWELHPLVVAATHRRQGVGRALVEDLERLVADRGALTLWLGADDEQGETSVGGVDVYTDITGAIARFHCLSAGHPGEFYRRLGFTLAGILPDANGPGKPDLFFAKRVSRTVPLPDND